MKKYILVLLVATVLFVPSLTHAQAVDPTDAQATYVSLLKQMISLLEQELQLLVQNQQSLNSIASSTANIPAVTTPAPVSTGGSTSDNVNTPTQNAPTQSVAAYVTGLATVDNQTGNNSVAHFEEDISLSTDNTTATFDIDSLNIRVINSQTGTVDTNLDVKYSNNSSYCLVSNGTITLTNKNCQLVMKVDYKPGTSGFYYMTIDHPMKYVSNGVSGVTNDYDGNTNQIYLTALAAPLR